MGGGWGHGWWPGAWVVASGKEWWPAAWVVAGGPQQSGQQPGQHPCPHALQEIMFHDSKNKLIILFFQDPLSIAVFYSFVHPPLRVTVANSGRILKVLGWRSLTMAAPSPPPPHATYAQNLSELKSVGLGGRSLT